VVGGGPDCTEYMGMVTSNQRRMCLRQSSLLPPAMTANARFWIWAVARTARLGVDVCPVSIIRCDVATNCRDPRLVFRASASC